MSTHAQLSSELVGWVPKLPPGLADILINRAWRDICDSRLWSFLVEDAQIFAPQIIDAGTVSVTQFSAQVTGNATASAAWLPQLLNTGAPFITRQFRCSTSGMPLNITAVDDANPAAIVLTLDKIYMGETGATETYQIYKCYYEAPTTDFLRWISVFNPAQGYWMRINKNARDINGRDPQRTIQGQAYWVANYKASSAGAPQFEFWPAPTSETVFAALYQRRGADLDSDEEIPVMIPSEFVMAKAKQRAGLWAIANQGSMPDLKGSDWRFFISESQKDYDRILPRVKKADDETLMQNLIARKKLYPGFVNDGHWLQTHGTMPFGY